MKYLLNKSMKAVWHQSIIQWHEFLLQCWREEKQCDKCVPLEWRVEWRTEGQ